MELRKAFGLAVKRRREFMEIGFLDLAVKSKTSQGNLSKIENGRGNPTLQTVATLCDALKTSPSALISSAEVFIIQSQAAAKARKRGKGSI